MITPQEAYQKARLNSQEMKRLEEKIDGALISGSRAEMSRIYVDAELFPNALARNDIMKKYRAAGWNVEYSSDQRDGEYLIFQKNEKNRTYDDWPYNHDRDQTDCLDDR